MNKRNGLATNDEIIGRISTLLKEKGMFEKDLVAYLGLAKGTYTNWKTNRSDSYLHFLKEICEFLDVTPNYLLLGDDGITVAKGEDIFSKEEMSMISKFRKLGLDEKKYVNILVDGMIEHKKGISC